MSHRYPSRSRRFGLGAVVLLALLLGAIGRAGAEEPTSPPDGPEASWDFTAVSTIFLPFATSSRGSTPPPPPPPPPTGGFLFLERAVKTASASTAADAAGGYHAAYIYYLPTVEPDPAVYAYCAGANCDDRANWREVRLLDDTREIQLALSPSGQPRLLIVTDSTVYNGGKDFHYAACDANCLSRGNWTVTRVRSSWGTDISDINADRTPQRTFALDPQGRPRFFYQDRNYFYREPDHMGAFYTYCDTNCTSAANWHETEVGRFINYNTEIFDLPSLTFTRAGQPRVISRVFAINDDGSSAPEGLYYYECNAGCDRTASWRRVFLMPTGGGSYPHPGWDIELDASDRPRVAIFTGDGLSPDIFNNRLLYLWCNSGCLSDTSWEYHNLGLAREDGEAPDLELDTQGRPRIAWIHDSGDLGYAWCNSACQSASGQWTSRTVETEDQLRADFPQAIPTNCDQDVWSGLAPVLALDGGGNPRIAYDVTVDARCLYDDPDDGLPPYYRFMPVFRAVRMTYFPAP